MAESLDSRHGTSDEYIDPFCDTCYESEGRNVRVCGFCKDCVQFLCSGCYNVHGKLQGCRHHDVVHGEDMPKSQADKPPRFEYCDAHPKLLKNQFCCAHKIVLCSVCSSADHEGCSIKTVEDVSETVDASETGELYDKIKRLQENMKSSLQSLDTKIKKLRDQEKTMLDDAQNIYDQIVAKFTKLFDDIKTEIRTKCQSQISLISRHQLKVNNIIVKLDSPLSGLADLKSKPIDTKIFLRLQEIVSFATKFTIELQESRKTLNFVSLTFVPSQPVQEYWSSSFIFGTIQTSDSKPEFDIMVPEISFPFGTYRQTATRRQVEEAQNRGGLANLLPRSHHPLSQIKATKQGTYNGNIKDGKYVCWTTGMAITKDRRMLKVDIWKNKVRMFSKDMNFLSSVSVPDRIWDIVLFSDKTAVVTNKSSLVTLNISGSKLSIRTTTQLSYDLRGISIYNNKLVVTSPGSKPPSVKLISQTGRVYWSVSSDQQGQPLFSLPWYVSSPGDGKSSTVIVTDPGNHTLTLLNGDTGEVITRRQLKEKHPKGITTDSAGNVYICYNWTDEVAVLSGDLLEEKILLSRQDGLGTQPEAIVYDDKTHQLIISYYYYPDWESVDCFQLS